MRCSLVCLPVLVATCVARAGDEDVAPRAPDACAGMAGSLHVAVAAAAVAAGDVDGDGRLDLVVLTSDAPPVVTVLRGLGDGRLAPMGAFATDALALAAADFDGDGRLDLALTDGAQLVAMRGRGDGRFVVASRTPIDPARVAGGLCTGDLDGDGRADVAVLIEDPSGAASIRTFAGAGDGHFAAVVERPVGDAGARRVGGDGPYCLPWRGARPVVAADAWLRVPSSGRFAGEVDVDGVALLASTGERAEALDGLGRLGRDRYVTRDRAGGALLVVDRHGEVPTRRLPGPVDFVVGDFDGDGIADVAVSGTLRFGPDFTRTRPTSAARLLLAADLDGDGRDDLVGRDADGTLVVTPTR